MDLQLIQPFLDVQFFEFQTLERQVIRPRPAILNPKLGFQFSMALAKRLGGIRFCNPHGGTYRLRVPKGPLTSP